MEVRSSRNRVSRTPEQSAELRAYTKDFNDRRFKAWKEENSWK